MVRFRPWDPTKLRFGEKQIGSSFYSAKQSPNRKTLTSSVFEFFFVKKSNVSTFPAVVARQIRLNDLEKHQNQRYDFFSTFYAEEEGIHGCIGRKNVIYKGL